jgi:hypothetical protein
MSYCEETGRKTRVPAPYHPRITRLAGSFASTASAGSTPAVTRAAQGTRSMTTRKWHSRASASSAAMFRSVRRRGPRGQVRCLSGAEEREASGSGSVCRDARRGRRTRRIRIRELHWRRPPRPRTSQAVIACRGSIATHMPPMTLIGSVSLSSHSAYSYIRTEDAVTRMASPPLRPRTAPYPRSLRTIGTSSPHSGEYPGSDRR